MNLTFNPDTCLLLMFAPTKLNHFYTNNVKISMFGTAINIIKHQNYLWHMLQCHDALVNLIIRNMKVRTTVLRNQFLRHTTVVKDLVI